MKLFILVADNGDGSTSLKYSLSPEVIQRWKDAYDNDELDYEYDPGLDADGFTTHSIEVPENSTYESLGIRQWSILKDRE